ncbi:DUF6286 domain-containing protein [Streptomyces sp. NBC_01476]|uniref:DUF6286 domain-containing protein n=1 Tax=Streptomyces sp. NBC_01476 TaxID=2903881 RepID=UPI002E2F2D8F|nr:DUF6286 domain-containing protein [Streptomyces sp. NBC_01476]
MSHIEPPADSAPDGEPTREPPTAVGVREPFPEPDGSRRYAGPEEEPGAAKRFWSGRRVPSAITAALASALAVLFLQDVVSVRADNTAQHWRRALAHQLATRHLDDTWVILGASVCAALGLWLLVLAVTPGERAVLPMARRGPSGVRAGLDRHAAELVLRDRAMEVPGVRSVKVAVGRRHIRAHAASHFRELSDVRQDVSSTLGQAVRQLGLAKPPRLRVRVRRAEKSV